MIEIIPNRFQIFEFLNLLRDEDKAEISALGDIDFKSDLIELFENNNKYSYFLLSDSKPLAIGGAKTTNNPKTAIVWMLCTNELNKNKVKFYKYVKNKIKFFKNEFDILYNFIYKSNFSSLKWLKKCGFIEYELKNKDYKLFYQNIKL